MSNIKYLMIEESNFNRLLNLFLQDNAVAYSIDGNVYFGIRTDLDKANSELMNSNLILLTKDLSCNVMVENSIVKMMTIYRP